MQELNKNTTGLALGGLVALAHLVWLILVALGLAKPFLDFVLSLHHISFDYSIAAFSFGLAIGLLVLTFVVGYVFGWIFAAIWNSLRK